MKSMLRALYAYGIVVVSWVVLTPDTHWWGALAGGVLIAIGAGGWNDR